MRASGQAAGPGPGYYTDPSVPGYVRYWDGNAWIPGTSRPAPADGEVLEPPAAAARAAAAAGGPSMRFIPPPTGDASGVMYLDGVEGLSTEAPAAAEPSPEAQAHAQVPGAADDGGGAWHVRRRTQGRHVSWGSGPGADGGHPREERWDEGTPGGIVADSLAGLTGASEPAPLRPGIFDETGVSHGPGTDGPTGRRGGGGEAPGGVDEDGPLSRAARALGGAPMGYRQGVVGGTADQVGPGAPMGRQPGSGGPEFGWSGGQPGGVDLSGQAPGGAGGGRAGQGAPMGGRLGGGGVDPSECAPGGGGAQALGGGVGRGTPMGRQAGAGGREAGRSAEQSDEVYPSAHASGTQPPGGGAGRGAPVGRQPGAGGVDAQDDSPAGAQGLGGRMGQGAPTGRQLGAVGSEFGWPGGQSGGADPAAHAAGAQARGGRVGQGAPMGRRQGSGDVDAQDGSGAVGPAGVPGGAGAQALGGRVGQGAPMGRQPGVGGGVDASGRVPGGEGAQDLGGGAGRSAALGRQPGGGAGTGARVPGGRSGAGGPALRPGIFDETGPSPEAEAEADAEPAADAEIPAPPQPPPSGALRALGGAAAGGSAAPATHSAPTAAGEVSWAERVHHLAVQAEESDEAASVGHRPEPAAAAAAAPRQGVRSERPVPRPPRPRLGAPRARVLARLVDTAFALGLAAAFGVPLGLATAAHIASKIDQAKDTAGRSTVWLVDGAVLGNALTLLAGLAAVVLVLEIVPTARTGRTPGKRLMGLRVLDTATRRPPGFGAAARRWVRLVLSVVLLYGIPLGLWRMARGPLHQCGHDRSAGTLVADAAPNG
ncbi:hypothetical protein BIV57_11120 [Mangrovactinospora gilvigrisea]|uniref:RDD domain-containing protein n=1 Tax=Mangrovactinospora gilvigrisea TaxID=1428644 RepID=A0A1J7C7B5_9ACTN|nr:RDD family protein [Mangrovactinospora gilvigrisea]OIV37420.1 hypothetical protein BIV57_11120 [Mangrovactinospora gilvigrisea]